MGGRHAEIHKQVWSCQRQVQTCFFVGEVQQDPGENYGTSHNGTIGLVDSSSFLTVTRLKAASVAA